MLGKDNGTGSYTSTLAHNEQIDYATRHADLDDPLASSTAQYNRPPEMGHAFVSPFNIPNAASKLADSIFQS